jgi:hydroxymethylbilane synthase
MNELRLATRRSPLALAQATIVVDALAAAGYTASIVPIVTTGDRDRHTPVTALSEVGAFVRAVQAAVIDGRADIAVHSGKDLPVDGPEGLAHFHPLRAAPWDVLSGSTLDDLPEGAAVGTGSPRRSAQLRLLRPDVDVRAIRGNVGTRLGKVKKGEVDAVVLAEAGLVRLGRTAAIDHRFTLDQMVPAPAQAAMTLEAMIGSAAAEALAEIEDGETRREVETERELLTITGAGCRSALGAYATISADGGLALTVFADDERGPRRVEVTGDAPVETARRAAKELGL